MLKCFPFMCMGFTSHGVLVEALVIMEPFAPFAPMQVGGADCFGLLSSGLGHRYYTSQGLDCIEHERGE